MKLHAIFVTVVLVIFCCNCEVYEEDYRYSYIGDFHFQVITEHWEYGTGIWYDTVWHKGEILFYDEFRDGEALGCYEDSTGLEERITIRFLPEYFISTGIDRVGKLIPCGGYHYYHKGGFISKNEIHFEVKGLGGLGRGWNYEVYGKRGF